MFYIFCDWKIRLEYVLLNEFFYPFIIITSTSAKITRNYTWDLFWEQIINLIDIKILFISFYYLQWFFLISNPLARNFTLLVNQ